MTKNLTLASVADLLGCSKRTVYRLLCDGEITAFKVRGSLRVPEESLEEYRRRQIAKFTEEQYA